MTSRVSTTTPTGNASVIGVSDRDRARDVATFFASHPFGGAEPLEKLPAAAFFRRFLDAPESSGGAR